MQILWELLHVQKVKVCYLYRENMPPSTKGLLRNPMCKFAFQRQAAGVLQSGAFAYPTKRSWLICSDWNSGRINSLPGLSGKTSC